MSAKYEDGMSELLQIIREHAYKNYVSCSMCIPFTRGEVFSYLKKHGIVEKTEYKEDGIHLKLMCRKEDCDRYSMFLR